MGLPRRNNVNRRSSARSFNRNEPRRHVFNMKIMRGGWRL